MQVVLAGWRNFQAVITGFEVVREPETESPNLKPEDGTAS
jgi:hypothetical protein